MVTDSLKDKNKLGLISVVLFNVAVYVSILNNGFEVDTWVESFADLQTYLPVVLVAVFVGILNSQLDHKNKARLVFWEWTYPLPGCRAFSNYIDSDPRIDKSALARDTESFPTDPNEQNRLWFRWYREHQEEPGVLQVHREYLFTRDYTALAFLFVVALGGLAIWQFEQISVAALYIGALIIQFLFVRQAATNNGMRFVCSVLAYKSTGNSV